MQTTGFPNSERSSISDSADPEPDPPPRLKQAIWTSTSASFSAINNLIFAAESSNAARPTSRFLPEPPDPIE